MHLITVDQCIVPCVLQPQARSPDTQNQANHNQAGPANMVNMLYSIDGDAAAAAEAAIQAGWHSASSTSLCLLHHTVAHGHDVCRQLAAPKPSLAAWAGWSQHAKKGV